MSCKSFSASPYRSHLCGALRASNVGKEVEISGWIHNKRDHGHLLFVDLRDGSGLVQCVAESGTEAFRVLDQASLESVVQLSGHVVARDATTVNPHMPTGAIEISVQKVTLLSRSDPLPLQVNHDGAYPEETRLKYRFLDLRRPHMQKNILLRSAIIRSLRRRMEEKGFVEFQTPILTSSSPEGARDFLVPSRLHPGSFYALPQAPQQFKQLLMAAGFDRYFQIAPCFRDEDSRADRSPGEFYQLDFEMAFVDQEGVFQTIEPVLHGLFEEFAGSASITPYPFPRIAYHDAMLRYGSDKPDLRNPLKIQDLSDFFQTVDFPLFKEALGRGDIVRAIKAPQIADKSRKYFDDLQTWIRARGGQGLGYIIFQEDGGLKGPIAKFLPPQQQDELRTLTGVQVGDGIFFLCGATEDVVSWAGALRTHLAEDLDLIASDTFAFCWVVDFPMYEKDKATGQITFSHNPFSMPQGGMEALLTQDPLDIKAWQYDIVCNGVELSSGAIRNHLPDVMIKAFDIAGYNKEHVEEQFGALFRAFHYGAPPHGGSAPGIDRMIMLLSGAPNLREVTAFPLNQQAQDLLMNAPAAVSDERLRELGIQVCPKKKSEII
jgi:aspartyl-tRNA synthetase